MNPQTNKDAAEQILEFETIDLRRYAEILLKRKWFILLVTALVAVIAMVWTLGQERIYSASCAIVIETQAPQVLGSEIREAVNIGAGSYWFSREYYETQYQIIRSREIAERVVERLGLQGDLGFLGIDRLPEERREEALARADAAAVLLGRLSVDPVRDSLVAHLRVEDRDPARAALIANTVAEIYMQANVERRVEGSRDAADWLDDQRRDLKQKLESSEQALYEFKKANDLVYTSLEDKQTMTTQKFATISDALTRTRLKRTELAARVRGIQAAQKSGDPDQLLAIDDVATSPFIIDLKKKYLESVNEQVDLSERYGGEHPRMKVAREKLENARESLRKEVAILLSVRLSQYNELQETERALVEMLAAAKREAFENNKKEIEYKRLAREEANNRGLFDLVLKRQTEIDLSSLLRTNNVRVLEPAMPPLRPIRPRPVMNLLVALALGLLAGMGLALLLDVLDQSVRGPEDLSALGLDCLGLLSRIPAGKGPARDRFVADAPQSVLSEQLRAIRTNMLFMRPDDPPRRIVITSAFPQEGKTTMLCSLGITLTQAGSRVLLVDSDMRRPRLHRSFGLKNEVGLSTAIAGSCAPEAAIQKTDVENLFVLPCGPIPPNPAELLHTRRFQEIVAELGDKFDRVLFDSPPAGVVADALILSNELDGTIFVVKAFKTERPAVARALHDLREAGAKVLGAILNNLSSEKRLGYYGVYYAGNYGSYYKYGNYAASDQKDPRQRKEQKAEGSKEPPAGEDKKGGGDSKSA